MADVSDKKYAYNLYPSLSQTFCNEGLDLIVYQQSYKIQGQKRRKSTADEH